MFNAWSGISIISTLDCLIPSLSPSNISVTSCVVTSCFSTTFKPGNNSIMSEGLLNAEYSGTLVK